MAYKCNLINKTKMQSEKSTPTPSQGLSSPMTDGEVGLFCFNKLSFYTK
jgi:hypothetical protein